MDAPVKYVDLHELARATGLPAGWLKREATARRLPCIRAGRRLMFDTDAVRKAVAQLQKSEVPRG